MFHYFRNRDTDNNNNNNVVSTIMQARGGREDGGQLWLTRARFSSLPLLFHAPTPLTGFHSTTKWLPPLSISIQFIRFALLLFFSHELRSTYAYKPFSPTLTRFKPFRSGPSAFFPNYIPLPSFGKRSFVFDVHYSTWFAFLLSTRFH